MLHVKFGFDEWSPIGKIAAHSAHDMFSWYKYLIVNFNFSHLGFWSGNLFLIASFPDLCLLVHFSQSEKAEISIPFKLSIKTFAYTESDDVMVFSPQ